MAGERHLPESIGELDGNDLEGAVHVAKALFERHELHPEKLDILSMMFEDSAEADRFFGRLEELGIVANA